MLYRSTHCAARRDALASVVRDAVRARNLTFRSAGWCLADRDAHLAWCKTQAPRHECKMESWAKHDCASCDDAKIMLAFENFRDGAEYLGEKLFLPLAHGAGMPLALELDPWTSSQMHQRATLVPPSA